MTVWQIIGVAVLLFGWVVMFVPELGWVDGLKLSLGIVGVFGLILGAFALALGVIP